MTLPDHFELSNAGQISEQLLAIINRGAVELIVDMTSTASCDHAGADAVVRAYQRATANGTQLRLVVTAQIVRRMLSLNGLDRLISIYPTLEAASAAAVGAVVTSPASRSARTSPNGQNRTNGAGQQRRQPGGEPGPSAITQAMMSQLVDALVEGVAQAYRSQELLDRTIASLFDVGLSLQTAIGLPPHTVRQRIADALQRLDETISQIRDHAFTTQGEAPAERLSASTRRSGGPGE